MQPSVSPTVPTTQSSMSALALKVVLGVVGFLAVLFGGLFLLTITNLDMQVIKPSLNGVVTDKDLKPIAAADVKLSSVTNPQTVPLTNKTDQDGRYSFTGLEIGRYKITISAGGFEELSQEIDITRSFLNYGNQISSVLIAAGNGSISGKFITNVADYNFILDKLTVDGIVYAVEADGSFKLDNLTTGLKTLTLETVGFKDITRQFQLNAGSNPNLQDIELSPAGDIFGNLTSYVRRDIVKDLQIVAEGVSSQQIKVQDNGDFYITDLEVNRSYTIRTSKPGYETRDYQVQVVQGINQIPNFKVVETGTIPFLFKVDKDLSILVSGLDGSNRKQLTFDSRMEPFAEYIDGDIIYFLSIRDRVNSTLGDRALLAYAVSTQGGNAQRITTSTTNLGRIIPNFAARKLANVTKGTAEKDRVLQVMDLTGNNRVQIEYLKNGVFNDIEISDNGAYVVYYKQDAANSANGLYRANAQSGSTTKLLEKPNITLYDVSQDGDRILYTTSNFGSTLTEMYVYTVSTGQDRRLLQNTAARTQFQFVGDSKEFIVYQSMRESANNIYRLNIDTDEEIKLTAFSGVEGVEAVYQQAKYILYQTNRGLYVMDPTKPVSGVLVTREMARYTGYDF
jgi:Tol biopolymer transport system component